MTQPWSISRLELRAPLTVEGGSFARVELVHDHLGRITDIGRGAGPMESILKAVGRIIGLEVDVQSINLAYRAPTAGGQASVVTDVVLRAGGQAYAGQSVASDVLTGCVLAYLEAAASLRAARATW